MSGKTVQENIQFMAGSTGLTKVCQCPISANHWPFAMILPI